MLQYRQHRATCSCSGMQALPGGDLTAWHGMVAPPQRSRTVASGTSQLAHARTGRGADLSAMGPRAAATRSASVAVSQSAAAPRSLVPTHTTHNQRDHPRIRRTPNDGHAQRRSHMANASACCHLRSQDVCWSARCHSQPCSGAALQVLRRQMLPHEVRGAHR